MTHKNDGGPAFPSKFTVAPGSNKPDGTIAGPNEQFHYVEFGMSLRDFFAGQALSCLAPLPINRELQLQAVHERARSAYALADAMLEARSK